MKITLTISEKYSVCDNCLGCDCINKSLVVVKELEAEFVTTIYKL